MIDTLRADHLGFAGHARPTSPHLDALAEQAVVFEQAIAPSSYMRESVVSLFTGRLPSRCGTGGWHTAPLPEAPHFGERLREAGYLDRLLQQLGDAAPPRALRAASRRPST